jgi:N6-adenosine-specific RNA methylase IME4
VAERYRTIVADPPWAYPEGFARSTPTGKSLNKKRDEWAEDNKFQRKELPYSAMSLAEIAALPVEAMAEPDCRLFLWTTNKWLPAAFSVAESWGFEYRQLLVWHKAEGGPFITSVAPNTAEFALVCVRGNPERIGSFPSQVLLFPAIRNHSTKPDGFTDFIEQVSPGPYLELFSRRARFGWDTWGDESLHGGSALAAVRSETPNE